MHAPAQRGRGFHGSVPRPPTRATGAGREDGRRRRRTRRSSCPGAGMSRVPMRASLRARALGKGAGEVLERDRTAPGQRRPGEIAEPGADPQARPLGKPRQGQPQRRQDGQGEPSEDRCGRLAAAPSSVRQEQPGQRRDQRRTAGWSGSMPTRCARPRPQRTAESRWVAPTPMMEPVMVWVVLTGMPPIAGADQHHRPRRLRAEAADGAQLGQPHPHGLHDPPAARPWCRARSRRGRRGSPRTARRTRGPDSRLEKSRIAMMPMVFCASLVPWPRL